MKQTILPTLLVSLVMMFQNTASAKESVELILTPKVSTSSLRTTSSIFSQSTSGKKVRKEVKSYERMTVDAYGADIKVKELMLSGQYQHVEPNYTVYSMANYSSSPNDPEFIWQKYWQDRENGNNISPQFGEARAIADRYNNTVRVAIIDGGFLKEDYFQDIQPVFHASVIDRDMDSGHTSRIGDSAFNEDEELECENGHGIGVAGLIGAIRDNNVEMAGAVNAELGLYQALLCGSGTMYDAAMAIRHAAGGDVAGLETLEKPFKVINLSLGAEVDTCPSYMQSEIDFAISQGSIVTVSAGNSSMSVDEFAPANCKGIVSTGALSIDTEDLADFSNYGDNLTLVTQGNDVFSLTHSYDGGAGFGYWEGTSFASPQTAAALSIGFEIFPELSYEQAMALLVETTTPTNNATECELKGCGNGMLDAAAYAAAVENALENNFGTLTSVLERGEFCDKNLYVMIASVRTRLCNAYDLTVEPPREDEGSVYQVVRVDGLSGYEVIEETTSLRVTLRDVEPEDEYGFFICESGDCDKSKSQFYPVKNNVNPSYDACND